MPTWHSANLQPTLCWLLIRLKSTSVKLIKAQSKTLVYSTSYALYFKAYSLVQTTRELEINSYSAQTQTYLLVTQASSRDKVGVTRVRENTTCSKHSVTCSVLQLCVPSVYSQFWDEDFLQTWLQFLTWNKKLKHYTSLLMATEFSVSVISCTICVRCLFKKTILVLQNLSYLSNTI